MFGEGYTCPAKPKPRKKPKPLPLGINYPGPQPYIWPHMGRTPNTDYDKRLLFYKQQSKETTKLYTEGERARLAKDMITMKYDTHAEKKRFQRQVQDRVKVKMEKYEEDLEKRRKKLQDLLAQEEREYVGETVDQAQRGHEHRLEEMKAQVQFLKAKREHERLELVEIKRLEQYMNRCQELRGAMERKTQEECRNCQLQQMRDNEAKREALREEDKLWYDVMMKEIRTKMDREEQEALEKYDRDKHTKDNLDMQVKGKEILKQEEARIMQEDYMELQKLNEEMRREELEALDGKMKKREMMRQELEEQIRIKQRFLDQRKKEEEALETAFVKLAAAELKQEQSKMLDLSSTIRKEMRQYEAHLKELEDQRKQEEKEFNRLIEEHKIAIQKKQDEAECKLKQARAALLKDTFEGRAAQIKYKKQEAEQHLKLKEAENELMRLACATNERLAEEYERAKTEAAKQYRQDLLKQVEYNNTLRERERQELERQLKDGMEQEEIFRKKVEDLIKGEYLTREKHPFRKALERYNCQCPQNQVTVKPPY